MAELNAAAISMDLQAMIVQGMGVAACQAGADHTYQHQMTVFEELISAVVSRGFCAVLSC
jgi:hypothetical protein